MITTLRPPPQPAARRAGSWSASGLVVLASLAGLAVGPVSLPIGRVSLEVLDHMPFVHVHSGLSPRQADIVWQLRLPRVVLGLLVGAMLSVAGGAYQGAFRNPLADPYLLGVAAGAGLGATVVIVAGARPAAASWRRFRSRRSPARSLPWSSRTRSGASGERRRSATSLVLAGVAVASFLTAVQTCGAATNVGHHPRGLHVDPRPADDGELARRPHPVAVRRGHAAPSCSRAAACSTC